MVKKLSTVIVCCILFAVSACVKPTTYPPYPIAVSATLSQTTESWYYANPVADSVLVTLAFTDGEGGIGPISNATDTTYLVPCNHAYDNAYLNDPTYNVYYYTYHASHISTDSCLTGIYTANVPQNPGSNQSLKGLIQFGIQVDCPGIGTAPDTLSYSVFFKDESGKFSNRIRTANLIISCQ